MKNIYPFLFLLTFCFIACDDTDQPTPEEVKSGKTLFQIELTDAPGDYQEVNIDIQKVRVQIQDSNWIDLTTNAGFYDLLKLQNGVDTTIVKDSLSKGTYITQMRLILGDSNNVMVDSQYFDLKIPSGSASGFKIQFQDSLVADSLNIKLDFDAEKSIIKKGNKNDYSLKPVIKVIK